MIREATENDLKQLAELYKELMVYHNRLDPKKYELPDDIACEKEIKRYFEYSVIYNVLCHETDNVVDGFVVYMLLNLKSSKDKPDGIIKVDSIVVAENARRKGIGTELINEMYRLAKENFCNTVSLDMHMENGDARKFYEKMGMIPTTIHMEMRL